MLILWLSAEYETIPQPGWISAALKHLPLQKAFKMAYNDRRYKIKNAVVL